MLNFKQKDCRFIVNEEKRTVVCLLERKRFSVTIDEYLQSKDIDAFNGIRSFNRARALQNTLRLPRRVSAKAVCLPEDKFDVELGKLIAFHKLKAKVLQMYNKRITYVTKYIMHMYDDMEDDFNKFYDKMYAEAERREVAISAEWERINKNN